ncbi:MAG: hypothetical protein HY744_15965 [Deltaproteobacteria bacterium]|nr:hypothetical protein [Deltaproteobacteria bacterium]
MRRIDPVARFALAQLNVWLNLIEARSRRCRGGRLLLARQAPPVEFRFAMPDAWSRRVLLALLRRYEIEPYRYRGQRRTTVTVRASRGFVTEILWPQFEQLSTTLRTYLDEVTSRVVAEVIHNDSSEAVERPDPRHLGPGPVKQG